METLEDTLIPLDEAEIHGVLDTAGARRTVLSRGKAVFSCTVTEAGQQDPDVRIPPECARMEYQWESNTVWQAQAWDTEGDLISDTVSNGKWVEAAGKRWHINYFLDPGNMESEDDFEEQRHDDGVSELCRELWCHSQCDGHLSLKFPLDDKLPISFCRALINRDSESGNIVLRTRTFKAENHYPVALFERLFGWVGFFIPIKRGKAYFDDPVSVQESELRIAYDAPSLHPLFAVSWTDNPRIGPREEGGDHWEKPISVSGGFLVPLLHENHSGLAEPVTLYRTELHAEASAFGSNVSTDIRPVNRDLPTVDW